MSFAASGNFEDGLNALQEISRESFKTDMAYILWIAKCYIMTDSPESAWECYMKSDDPDISYEILQLIANESYKMAGFQFYYAAKAFSELVKIDQYPDYIEGMIGACVGYFRQVVYAKLEENNSEDFSDELMEMFDILESTASPKCEKTAKTIRSWTDKNDAFSA